MSTADKLRRIESFRRSVGESDPKRDVLSVRCQILARRCAARGIEGQTEIDAINSLFYGIERSYGSVG